jgi:hypothetical protein
MTCAFRASDRSHLLITAQPHGTFKDTTSTEAVVYPQYSWMIVRKAKATKLII